MPIPPAEPLALRKTVIAGETAPDDYRVIWNGVTIGRILKVNGRPDARDLVVGRGLPGQAAAAGAPGPSVRPRGMQATLQGGVGRDPSDADGR